MTAAGQLLRGRKAVVTGAANGIGRAIAHRFAEHGASVALLDLAASNVRQVAADIAAATGAATVAVTADVADQPSLRQALAQVEDGIGGCDLVVANAGVFVLDQALSLTYADFDRVQRINLGGAFSTATVFGRRMVEADTGGSIIFTSSLFGRRGGRGNAAYSASKFAILGLAQSMAAELAAHHIRVNTVCPGQIDSDMLQQLFRDRAAVSGRSAAQEQDAFVERIPLGRLGSPADVADTFVFLASDMSSYITGQDITVDGGWTVG